MTTRELHLHMNALLSDRPPLSKEIKSLMNDYFTPIISNYIINSRDRIKI